MPKTAKAKAKINKEDIEKVYTTTITYTCPVRGVVSEEVEVIRYKPQKTPDDKPIEFAMSELYTGDEEDDIFNEETLT
jgi:hypothetical protein